MLAANDGHRRRLKRRVLRFGAYRLTRGTLRLPLAVRLRSSFGASDTLVMLRA